MEIQLSRLHSLMLQNGQRAIERAQNEQEKLIRIILAGHDIELPAVTVQFRLNAISGILTLDFPDDDKDAIQEEATPAA